MFFTPAASEAVQPHRLWNLINRRAADTLLAVLFGCGIAATFSTLEGFSLPWMILVLFIPTMVPVAAVAIRVGTEAIQDGKSLRWAARRATRYWRWLVVPVAICGELATMTTPLAYIVLAAFTGLVMSVILRTVKTTSRIGLS